jgi:hypothetical protein
VTELAVDPHAVATSLLQAVVDGFAGQSVALPSRQVLIAGVRSAWDGEQVTVALQRVYVGLPGQEQSAAGPWQQGVFTGEFAVEIVRKATATLANTPRRLLPGADKIGNDAQVFMQDVRILAAALHTAKRTGALRSGTGKVRIGPVLALEQQGELYGCGSVVDVVLA